MPSAPWIYSLRDPPAAGFVLYVSFWISLFFWISDLCINLNTAIYAKGTLVTSRSRILFGRSIFIDQF